VNSAFESTENVTTLDRVRGANRLATCASTLLPVGEQSGDVRVGQRVRVRVRVYPVTRLICSVAKREYIDCDA
jgi:hypothetical protein